MRLIEYLQPIIILSSCLSIRNEHDNILRNLPSDISTFKIYPQIIIVHRRYLSGNPPGQPQNSQYIRITSLSRAVINHLLRDLQIEIGNSDIDRTGKLIYS